jgi:hypothetical protein
LPVSLFPYIPMKCPQMEHQYLLFGFPYFHPLFKHILSQI